MSNQIMPPGSGLPAPTGHPGRGWLRRLRPVYNTLCILVGWPLTEWWAHVLGDARVEAGLAGAWVIALVPLGIAVFADHVYSIAAAGAHPDLWMPKVRAALARTAMWSALLGMVMALPVASLVYVITGVRA